MPQVSLPKGLLGLRLRNGKVWKAQENATFIRTVPRVVEYVITESSRGQKTTASEGTLRLSPHSLQYSSRESCLAVLQSVRLPLIDYILQAFSHAFPNIWHMGTTDLEVLKSHMIKFRVSRRRKLNTPSSMSARSYCHVIWFGDSILACASANLLFRISLCLPSMSLSSLSHCNITCRNLDLSKVFRATEGLRLLRRRHRDFGKTDPVATGELE